MSREQQDAGELTESTGVLYVVSGDEYVNAAIRSAQTVRRHNPQLPVHFFVDAENAKRPVLGEIGLTSVSIIENPHVRSKVDYLALTPFDRTLYLDSDTSVLSDLSELFVVLERFDIGLTHAHARNRALTKEMWRTSLPYAFPQFNTGVVLYRKNAKVLQLLKSWSDAYKSAAFKKDQTTLRELLWHSDLRIATLPPEYNVRYLKYLYLWARRETEPKILHLAKYHYAPLFSIKGLRQRLKDSIGRIVSMFLPSDR